MKVNWKGLKTGEYIGVKMRLIQCKNSQNILKMQLLNECNYMYLFSYLKNWDVYDCIVYSIVACAAFAQDDTYSV